MGPDAGSPEPILVGRLHARVLDEVPVDNGHDDNWFASALGEGPVGTDLDAALAALVLDDCLGNISVEMASEESR